MRKRIAWIAFALLAFSLDAILGYSLYEKYMIYKYGDLVEVSILSVPKADAKRQTVKFEFEGRHYVESPYGGTYYFVGEKLRMKHLKGNDMFLSIGEDPTTNWPVLPMIAFLGIACVYYALKKDPPPIEIPGISR